MYHVNIDKHKTKLKLYNKNVLFIKFKNKK